MIEPTDMPKPVPSAKDLLMRFTPPVIALTLLAAVTSSVGYTTPTITSDPRAKALLQQGQTALDAGQADKAVDAFESALVVEPANPAILVSLAQATRREGMQGKALRYYREALAVDPHNVNAISGEGAALAEKGAIEKAKLSLAQLEGLCGSSCNATRDLEAAIARGPLQKSVKTAEAAPAAPSVSQN
jgi:cytochrome c-type biogenesis protein CcmH/NrfG